MKAYPLEVPLRSLPDLQRVFVVRFGLVYSYPAAIVADIANDLYTADVECPLSKSLGWTHWESDLWRTYGLRRAAHAVWDSDHSGSLFHTWWDSIDTSVEPALVIEAARIAASEVMTYSLFKHRWLDGHAAIP